MLGEIGIRVPVAARPMREHFPMVGSRETDFYMLSWATGTYDSLEPLSYLVRSDGPYSATGYANPRVDGLIDAIGTELVTYARDAMIEEVWKAVRDDIVFVPLHQQIWAMRDQLELPVDPGNWPRLARLNSQQ
jgi:peptide/nickel transport system substrate-binding protein